MYNIMVVEDDEVDRLNIERVFKKAKMRNPYYFANDGVEAIELLKRMRRPLLILLDINMPRMNGFDFLTELRSDLQWAITPVVVLSSSAEPKDKGKAYSFNVSGYIVKPVDFSDFCNVVKTLDRYWTICEFP